MKIKPQISNRVYGRFKRMCLTAGILASAAYLGEHYIRNSASEFLATDSSSYSGLFVNADELGFEGER